MSENEIIDNIKSAFELQRKGQYREAIAVLYKVLALEPDNVEALIQIAYLLPITQNMVARLPEQSFTIVMFITICLPQTAEG